MLTWLVQAPLPGRPLELRRARLCHRRGFVDQTRSPLQSESQLNALELTLLLIWSAGVGSMTGGVYRTRKWGEHVRGWARPSITYTTFPATASKRIPTALSPSCLGIAVSLPHVPLKMGRGKNVVEGISAQQQLVLAEVLAAGFACAKR
jgi:hypothetical protein